MAHVPDLVDFTAGLAELCDDRTMITVENPSYLNLLREVQFDTIYHEHFSYLTAHAVTRVVRAARAAAGPGRPPRRPTAGPTATG